MSFLEHGLNAAAYVMRPATQNESVYRTYLRLRGARKPSLPEWTTMNRALRSKGEVAAAVAEAERIGLFRYYMDVVKTWDSLSALSYILRATDIMAKVLDAGSSLYSVILPWLSLYGYRRLVGMNLSFPGEMAHGPISYVKGDVAKTKFTDGGFGAITCLSVVEHLPDLHGFLREMSRLLQVGGPLIISTDFWPEGVHTGGKREFNAEFNVFNQEGLRALIRAAATNGLELTGEPDLRVGRPLVKWHGFQYTFVVLAFKKVART
jgi:SAM-dependent methyltransferase